MEYMPHYLKNAGYRTECRLELEPTEFHLLIGVDLGKFLNGYSLFNFESKPKGWDYTDCMVCLYSDFIASCSQIQRELNVGQMDPYNAAFNQVVMSRNGEWPVTYPGYHQADVMRAKM